MDIQDIIVAGISAAIGTGGATTVAWPLLRTALHSAIESYAAEHRAMQAELKNLRDEKVASLHKRVSKVEENCQQHAANTAITELHEQQKHNQETLQRIEGLISQVGDKVDKVSLETAAISKDLENKDGWISKLDANLSRHVENLGMHHGSPGRT